MSQQGYIGRNPGDGRTIINRQTSHVTTGVQTSFTMTVGYEVGFLDVYLNGIKQTETLDYTAADGSTINFSPSFAPMNGDVLEFVAFETLNITNIKSARRNFSVGQDLDVSGKVTIGSSLTVASDLVVNGTFTTINTEILDVEDKTVGIASTSSPSNTTADGAGIVIYGGSDGDKSILWNTDKSNFVIVGGGVSIGTGVTISTPAANVLAFSVNSAEKARFNNFGAFTVGYEGEAWHESTYVGVLQAGSGAWIGQTPGASARAEWVNNAYYDSVNTRWEYIAADEANRIVLENGELKLQSADAGSADGAITWNEKLKMTVGGDFKIGAPTGIGITISSSGNVDSIGIITATSFVGNGANLTGVDVVSDTSPQLGGNLDVNTKNIVFGDSSGASDDRLTFGASTDLSIYHDGSHSRIDETGTGNLMIQSDNAVFIKKGTAENIAVFNADGAVDLYHNNVKTFETDANGIKLLGPEGGEAEVNLFADEGDDNADKWRIQALAAGGLNIQNFTSGSWENNLIANGNGSVELYHDNVKKFDTISTGIRIHGDEGGTAQLHFLADEGDDNADYWRIIGETSGPILNFQSYNSGNWTNNVRLTGDQGVELYWNNGVKLATSNAGVTVTGRVTTDELTVQKASGNLSVMVTADSGLGTLEIGGSTGAFIDLKHPASDDYDVRLGATTNDGYLNNINNFSLTCNGKNAFYAAADSGVQLYFNGVSKLQTTTYGVYVDSTTDAIIEMHTSNATAHSRINFSNNNGDNTGGIWYSASNHMQFRTASDYQFTISATNGRLERSFGGGSGAGSDLDGMWFNNDQAATGTFVRFWQTSGSYGANQIGSISHTANNTAYNTSSDYRLKENVVAISDGITRVKTLKPYRFNFISEPSKTVDGFFAHEAATVVPEAVTGAKDAVADADDDAIGQKKGDPIHQGMDYGKITPLLTAALQELITKVETLEAENTALKARVTTLEGS